MSSVPFDAVLFDMDNTLHSLHEARLCAADGVMAYTGHFPELQFYSLNRDNPDLLRRSLTDYYQEHHLENVEEGIWLYHRLEIACLRPFESVIHFVLRLKKEGKKLAVITNADRNSTAVRIGELGLEGTFDLIVTPETFGVKKPHPKVYQKTLEFLGVPANRAVMIGDTLNRDVMPAREEGIAAVHAWFGSLDEKDTICCADTPEEVETILTSFAG